MSGGAKSVGGAAKAPGSVYIGGVEFTTPRMHRLNAKHGELRTVLSRWEDPKLFTIKALPKVDGAVSLWQVFGALMYTSIMAVDADGAPDAYGPAGTAHQQPYDPAGVVTDGAGKAIKQTSGAYNGFYLSSTSLVNPERKAAGDPSKFVDANKIPYIAVNGSLTYADSGSYGKTNLPSDRVEVGDYALVVNKRDRRYAYAMVAEIKHKKNGEGSIRLCEDLGLAADPVRGNDSGYDDIVYVIFPGSGDDYFPKSDFTVAKNNKANDRDANESIAHINTEGSACYSNWIARMRSEIATGSTLNLKSPSALEKLPLDIVQAVSTILFQAKTVLR